MEPTTYEFVVSDGNHCVLALLEKQTNIVFPTAHKALSFDPL